MKHLILLSLLLSSACAFKPLTQKEKRVRILRHSDAPATCDELGKVTAPGLSSLTMEGREKDLKRNTSKIGGDTVAITQIDSNYTIYGIAFKCKK